MEVSVIGFFVIGERKSEVGGEAVSGAETEILIEFRVVVEELVEHVHPLRKGDWVVIIIIEERDKIIHD